MNKLLWRIAGFIAGLILYLFLAMNFFVQIMMGDCESEDVAELAACEAARSNNLLVLAIVTLLVVALLAGVFFVRGRKDKGK